ncbi:MAG: hypothetical protein ABJF10_17015, partial [Chthoniobacter sp.]|uniref:hypothetical protein n=1 Tax=Chthoniobacter sp. TaxID=2510640 RepID=UPI0032A45857
RLRSDHSEVLNVPAATVHFSWRELRRRFIREIVIESPQLELTDQTLAALPGGSGGDSPGASGLPWHVGHIAISNGRARIDVAAAPVIRCHFALDFSEASTHPDATRNQLRLTSLRARLRDEGADAIGIAALTIKFSPEQLGQMKIDELVVDSPHFVVTDRLMALIPQSSTGGPGPAWSIGSVSIEKGKGRVELAAWPRMQFGFSAQFADPQRKGNAPLALNLDHVSAHLRQDGSESLSVASARIVATVEGLRAQKIREIAIEDPHVIVTDSVLAAFTPSATPPAATAAPTIAPPSTPWTLERLSIKRGLAKVDLRGAPLAEFGFAIQMADAAFSPTGVDELQSVEINDLALRPRDRAIEPFLRVPAIRADFRIPEFLRTGRIARVQIERLDFRYNASFREMIAAGGKPAVAGNAPVVKDSTASAGYPITIAELRLIDGRVYLNDLGIGVPPIDFRLETALRELSLTPGAGAAGQELQKIELAQVALSSPLDPFFSVLKLDSLFIRFTLAGLWRREIEEVEIVHPVLAIGPDLFWYVDRVQENAAAAPAPVAAVQDTGPAWSIRHFNATSGQMILALEGQRTLAVPMPFESHADNLNFRNLSDLRLKLAIDMPEQDYQYPGYELTLRGVRGRVEFSLPPEKRANNVVNTLHLREVCWKNFRGRDCVLDVTYDARGIYGHLGGKAYTGQLNGQFNFLLADKSPWNGWIAGEHIDLQQVTGILAPEKLALSGPADFRLSVTARATVFDSVIGDFAATRTGQLRIGKLDDLIRELPGDWSGLKSGLARISLETLRDFAYTAAHGDFRFHGRSGALHLDLRGANGSRQIAVAVHDDASPEPAVAPVVASRP